MTPREAAERAGERWALEQIAELEAERRPICGGFPGTLREAQARFAAVAPKNATSAEKTEGGRAAYAAARRVWLARQRPEEAEDTPEKG